jgi:DNA polymerase-1
VEPDELDALKPLVRQLMEDALPMSVPIKADVKVGKNWDEMS